MRRLSLAMLCALIALLFSVGLSEHKAEAQTGYASWYSMPGAYTASGQVITASTWGAAHRTLPFGTELTVCYAGRCAYDVPVIDRGPYVYGRDLHGCERRANLWIAGHGTAGEGPRRRGADA